MNRVTHYYAVLLLILVVAGHAASDLKFGAAYSLLHVRTQPDTYPLYYDNDWKSPANLDLHLIHSTEKFRSHTSLSFQFTLLQLSNTLEPFYNTQELSLGANNSYLKYWELRYTLQSAYLRRLRLSKTLQLNLGVNIVASIDSEFESAEGYYIILRALSLIPALRAEIETALPGKTDVMLSLEIPPMVYRRVQKYSEYSYDTGKDHILLIHTLPYLSGQGGLRCNVLENTALELSYRIVLEQTVQRNTIHRRFSESVRLGAIFDL